jgi:hypothetical protein
VLQSDACTRKHSTRSLPHKASAGQCVLLRALSRFCVFPYDHNAWMALVGRGG